MVIQRIFSLLRICLDDAKSEEIGGMTIYNNEVHEEHEHVETNTGEMDINSL